MAALTTALTSRAGLDLGATAVAASGGGDSFVPNISTFFYVSNQGGGSINVTFVTPMTIDGLAVADRVVAVGAGVRMLIGPFDPAPYGNPCSVTYSGVTSVNVAAIQLSSSS